MAKRNPQDTTLRNINALKKRVHKLEVGTKREDKAIRIQLNATMSYLSKLEKVINKLVGK